jgi:hypothetical protein
VKDALAVLGDESRLSPRRAPGVNANRFESLVKEWSLFGWLKNQLFSAQNACG